MFDEVTRRQRGVLTRKQALSMDISDHDIEERLSSGEWQHLYWGVYATFTGKVPRISRLWAAVLRAGVIAHTDETRSRDRLRDNLNAIDAVGTLRYGWGEVHDSPCEVTRQVSLMLVKHGWTGTPYACARPSCPFRAADEAA